MGEICGVRNSPWSSERKKYWLGLSGGRLNDGEKLYAAQFTELLDNSNYDFIEILFLVFKGNESWKKIEERLGDKNADILKSVFRTFLPRFNEIWKQEKSYLEEIKKFISSVSEKLETAFCDIKSLCGVENNFLSLTDIPVHLTISSNRYEDILGWYSVLDKRVDLVMERSAYLDDKNKIFFSLVLLHELFHLALLNNNGLKGQIEQIAANNQKIFYTLFENIKPRKALEELLVSSFLPEGYLAYFYFKSRIILPRRDIKKNKFVNLTLARQVCAFRMKDIAGEYIRAGKEIDEAYILVLVEVIKKEWQA